MVAVVEASHQEEEASLDAASSGIQEMHRSQEGMVVENGLVEKVLRAEIADPHL